MDFGQTIEEAIARVIQLAPPSPTPLFTLPWRKVRLSRPSKSAFSPRISRGPSQLNASSGEPQPW